MLTDWGNTLQGYEEFKTSTNRQKQAVPVAEETITSEPKPTETLKAVNSSSNTQATTHTKYRAWVDIFSCDSINCWSTYNCQSTESAFLLVFNVVKNTDVLEAI